MTSLRLSFLTERNGDNDGNYMTRLLWGTSELIFIKLLKHWVVTSLHNVSSESCDYSVSLLLVPSRPHQESLVFVSGIVPCFTSFLVILLLCLILYDVHLDTRLTGCLRLLYIYKVLLVSICSWLPRSI